MEWTDTELDELASFFSKRLTPDLKPVDPTDPPPPGDPTKPWKKALREARDRNGLPALAARIAPVLPDDANLQSACALLQGAPRATHTGVWLAAAAVVLVAGGAGLAGLSSLSATPPRTLTVEPAVVAKATPEQPIVAPEAAAPPEAAPVSPAVSVPVEEVSEPLATEPAVDVADMADAPEAAPEGLADAPATPAEAPVPPTNPTARCAGTPGEVVGYWYAGTEKPGGALRKKVVLDKTVNVRADYPDVHNGFDKRSPVQCVLMEGDRVQLVRDPIEVPGNAYWVPLVAGSVEVPGQG